MNSFSIQNEHIKVNINKKGAEMSSLLSLASNQEYLWQADPKFWGRHAPVLFPIVGQVQDGKYKIDNETFELSQHGFARDTEFELLSGSGNKLVFMMAWTPETLKKYPYKFELQISYEVVGARVNVGYRVINRDEQKIWFSIGAHPAFNCPQQPNQSFDDFSLVFEKAETIDKLNFDQGLLSGTSSPYFEKGQKLNLRYNEFDEDAIIFEGLKSTYVDMKSDATKEYMRFYFKNFPFFAIWSPPGKNAPFVCLEPWYGITDTRNANLDYREKKGIQSLEVGEEFYTEYGMEIMN